MQIRPHRCLLIRAGRVDPDVVAILTGAGRVAIVAVIITLIGTRPLPIICRKANLVRGAVIGTALLSGHIFETSSGAPACLLRLKIGVRETGFPAARVIYY